MNGLKDRGTALENEWARRQDAEAIRKLREKDKATTPAATDKATKKSS